jgi:hypothetical protein
MAAGRWMSPELESTKLQLDCAGVLQSENGSRRPENPSNLPAATITNSGIAGFGVGPAFRETWPLSDSGGAHRRPT